MVNYRNNTQQAMECVFIDQLVPHGQLLRKIDQYIDFLLFMILLKTYIAGITADLALTQLSFLRGFLLATFIVFVLKDNWLKKSRWNVAYRGFLDYSLTEKIHDALTISQNRRRHFNGVTVFQAILTIR